MKTQSWRSLVLLLALFSLNRPGHAATLVWTNVAGGNWSVAANWEPHQVPGAGDDVMLTTPGGYTVTGDVAATVRGVTLANAGLTFQVLTNVTVTVTNGLNFSAGVISGPGGLNLGGSNTWSGGILNGASRVTVAAGASFTISGNVDHDLPGAYLTNNGTIFHSGGRVRGGLGSVVNNAGTWLEQVDADINDEYGGGPLTFNNSGTLHKTVGAGSTRFCATCRCC